MFLALLTRSACTLHHCAFTVHELQALLQKAIEMRGDEARHAGNHALLLRAHSIGKREHEAGRQVKCGR